MRWPERTLQRHVIDLARTLGYGLIYHTYFSDRSEAGYPDLHLVRPGRSLFVELKATKGRVTPTQDAWIAGLRDAGVEVHVWRPADWIAGTIAEVLA